MTESAFRLRIKNKLEPFQLADVQDYFLSNSPDEIERVEQTLSPGVSQFSYEPVPWKGQMPVVYNTEVSRES